MNITVMAPDRPQSILRASTLSRPPTSTLPDESPQTATQKAVS